MSPYCNPTNGQCTCQDNHTGRRCDSCERNYYDIQQGCQPCGCNADGSQPGEPCDPNTGICLCKRYVEGQFCDQCKNETHGLGTSTAFGCQPCSCNQAGTIGNSNSCDPITGNCVCKTNVEGATCASCKNLFYGLNEDEVDGCLPCDCDTTGISGNNGCSKTEGQCYCVNSRTGTKCDQCQEGKSTCDQKKFISFSFDSEGNA